MQPAWKIAHPLNKSNVHNHCWKRYRQWLIRPVIKFSETSSASKPFKKDMKTKENVQNEEPHVPHYKQIIKDIEKLKMFHINSSDQTKNVSIEWRSLSGFLTVYQTLKHQFSNYKVFLRDLKRIISNHRNAPTVLKPKSDDSNFMKNVMNSLISKEGVFTDFPEGPQALALTSNGHEVLNILLARAHT